MVIFKKLPGWNEIASVYAVIVMMIYGWTIIRFFWKVPSWLLFMNIRDLLSALAFILSANLVESLLVLAGLLLLCLVLPSRWFRASFITSGSLTAAVSLGYLMLVADRYRSKTDLPTGIFAWAPAVVLIIALLLILFTQVSALRRPVENLADRATIFLYISIPLSALALIHVGIDAIF